jgi:TorA maturation chaperone TorD
VEEEYDGVFVGVGKAPVSLYTCAYSIRYANEAPLVDLKAQLADLGLARQAGSSEPEDHVAALCDVMRNLIAEKKADLAVQKVFFDKWIWPTAEPLCTAIRLSNRTSFYKAVAAFAFELCALEHSAFEML